MNQHRIKSPLLIAICVLMIIPAAVWAGDGKGDAGQPGEFLYYGTGIRSLGLGHACVALTDDAGSIFFNPAGLMQIERVWDIRLMHFNPFNMSRYNSFAAAYSNPRNSGNGLYDFFLGPHSALSIGFVEMASGDYEFRDMQDQFYGTFGVYQQALLTSFARREIFSWCKLDYGVGFKIVRQGFSGISDYDSDLGTGLDLGVQIQFIHPKPLANTIPLRLLLPLRLGFSAQNFLLRPRTGTGDDSDKYPSIYRMGFSYLLNLPKQHDLLLTGDATVTDWQDRSTKWSLGTEFHFNNEFAPLFIRSGGFYQSDKLRFTAGLGIKKAVKENLTLQADFAREFHTNLENDLRFSIGIAYGLARDADEVRTREDSTQYSYQIAMEMLACYPYRSDKAEDTSSAVIKAAIALKESLDVPRKARYEQFIGGLTRARSLVEEARDLLRFGPGGGRISNIQEKAHEASDIFAKKKKKCEDDDFALWAEACLLVAEVEPGMKSVYADSALQLLPEKSNSPRINFLKGRCYELRDMMESAIAMYEAAAAPCMAQSSSDFGKICDSLNLSQLTQINIVACKVREGIVDDNMIKELETKLNGQVLGIIKKASYLPYPAYPDGIVADDALYWISQCYKKLNDKDEENAALAEICKLYPGSDRCRDIKNTD